METHTENIDTYLISCFYFISRLSSGVVANVLDSDIVINEFKLQSCYYVHFRTNAPWEKY